MQINISSINRQRYTHNGREKLVVKGKCMKEIRKKHKNSPRTLVYAMDKEWSLECTFSARNSIIYHDIFIMIISLYIIICGILHMFYCMLDSAAIVQ